MRETGVQNVLVVEPSVPDGGSENLSQSESTTPEQFCIRVSRMRQTGVQNVLVVEPSVPDGDRYTSRTARALHRNGSAQGMSKMSKIVKGKF